MRSKAKQAREAEQAPARVKALTGSMAAPTAKKTSRNSVYLFAIALFLTSGGLFAFLVWNASLPVALLGGVAVGLVASSTVRIAPQWERVVVLRLGKFNRIDGPGLYVVAPVVESVAARVDQRIITTPFSAEEAVTADLVPLGIDAVLFWMVWDPKDACVEVEDYSSAVWWAAQTALRDAVGRINLAEVATRREQLDNEIKRSSKRKRVRGASRLSRWRFAISLCRQSCRTLCPKRPKLSESVTRVCFSPRWKRTSLRCL